MADDNDDEKEYPELKNFNEGIYTAKRIAGKTVKGGLIGAAVGGVGIPALIGLAGMVGLAASGPIGWIVGLVGGGTALGTGIALPALGAIAANTALIGGAAGAVIGAGSGIANADEDAKEKIEDIKAQSDRNKMRRERAEVAHMQHDQQAQAMEIQAHQMGLRPDQHLPSRPMDGGPGLA